VTSNLNSISPIASLIYAVSPLGQLVANICAQATIQTASIIYGS